MIVTRIAPSPTGMFHLGTARTAYFNWLMAKSNGGKFIVRIDDTDVGRNNPEYTSIIFESLEWLGLDFDDSFSQSGRLDRYKEIAALLIDANFAQRMDDQSVVFTYPDSFPNTWKDLVGGNITVSNQDALISSRTVLIRKDGMPTYHFSTVVDDIDFNITDVIRGSDHISNTLRQIFLREIINKVCGTSVCYNFSHIGLIHKDGKKMSKRDGASDLLSYKKSGYDPEAVLAYIIKLGWNVADPNIDKQYPFIKRQTALLLFNTGKMRAPPSNFSQEKLDWISNKIKTTKSNL